MIIRFITTLVFVSSVFYAATVTADITIDRYTTGSTLAQIGAGTSNQTTVHTSILGGERDTTLTVADLGGSEFFGVVGFGGQLQLAQGNNDQIQGSLLYNNFSRD